MAKGPFAAPYAALFGRPWPVWGAAILVAAANVFLLEEELGPALDAELRRPTGPRPPPHLTEEPPSAKGRFTSTAPPRPWASGIEVFVAAFGAGRFGEVQQERVEVGFVSACGAGEGL